METAYRRCCGMDVHKKSVMAHVLPPQGRGDSEPLEREFRTYSRDLRSLRGWLKSCRVTRFTTPGVTGATGFGTPRDRWLACSVPRRRSEFQSDAELNQAAAIFRSWIAKRVIDHPPAAIEFQC